MSSYNPKSTAPTWALKFVNEFDDSIGLHEFKTLMRHICEDVGSDFSVYIDNSIRTNSDFTHAVWSCDISPLAYSDPVSYLKDAQIAALIKKNPSLPTEFKPKLEAMKTFIACELKCSRHNELMVSKSYSHDFAFGTFLGAVREKISKVLGEAPSIEDLGFEFGPGAAYSIKRNTSSLDKLGGRLDTTPNCFKIAHSYVSSCPGWRVSSDFLDLPFRPQRLNVVVGDRLAFVPKTAKTDRPIAIGPLINGLIQKGLGSAIRRKLKPVIDLDNTQGKHRELARLSSIDGSLCTIDLRSASDTISYEVVRQLLPHDWFLLLDASRSQWYEIEGRVYPYHKFSAMGNGYTFELETLIFWAIASCCVPEDECVSVYGDDIIAPSFAFDEISRRLEKLGFEVNTSKSFNTGFFRESCGGDFFQGIDVRPFFLKDSLSKRTLFLFHNYLVRTGYQHYYPSAYRYIRKLIGRKAISWFKTWNYEDDGALLDLSYPISSYNRIVTREVGKKSNKLKASWGAANLLYRLQFVGCESKSVVDWRSFRTSRYRVVHKLYRYAHI